MLFLLDTSTKLKQAERELEQPVGQLLTPLTRFANRGRTFAIDNGAFSKFNADRFTALLQREIPNRERCLFVAAPDVVGSARRTLECFDFWYPKLHGWPIALVMQDGQENLPIPWTLISAAFIGGSTEFKMSAQAEQIVKTAKVLNKWVHIGRVNTIDRYKHFIKLGADSCDGTGISRYSHMRLDLAKALRKKAVVIEMPLIDLMEKTGS